MWRAITKAYDNFGDETTLHLLCKMDSFIICTSRQCCRHEMITATVGVVVASSCRVHGRDPWMLFGILPASDGADRLELRSTGMAICSYVLVLASPVFRAMLTADMFEDKSTYNLPSFFEATGLTKYCI